ncbi:type A2 lantipeptide, partial [Streptomyces javensis]|nr:type A2 lantipeptide [Streptomyces javensis]
MRKQIEAIEIADSELDNVSGGVLGTVNLTGGAEPTLP